MTPDRTAQHKPGLAADIIGVWSLRSREDRDSEGRRHIDAALGQNPVGILTYAPAHFAAQFMKRDRSADMESVTAPQGENNTGAIGGYDAYFGTYEFDDESGTVVHRLTGALTPSNVGIKVSRKLQVRNDQLTIQLATTTPEGTPVTRTLIWKRVG